MVDVTETEIWMQNCIFFPVSTAHFCLCVLMLGKENPSFSHVRKGQRQNAKASDHLVHYETLSQHDSDFMDLCLAVKVPLQVRCRSSGQPVRMRWECASPWAWTASRTFCLSWMWGHVLRGFRGKVSQNIQVFVQQREIFLHHLWNAFGRKRQEVEKRGTSTMMLLQYFRTSGYPMYFQFDAADTL